MKKVILAGGTGFIGKYLAKKYKEMGAEVIVVARSQASFAHKHIAWNDEHALVEALEDADLLINLAGKSVDCRYTEKNKALIFSSRTQTTQALGNALQKCLKPPLLWLNASTATIYRHAEDRPMTESTGEIGTGFSVEVAKLWEKTFFDFKLSDTRQVALRIAIVLGKDGGAFIPLKRLAQFGMGGKHGNGRQMFSWIHIEDLFEMIEYIRKNSDIEGVVNCSSPNPITNAQLMRMLRKSTGALFGLPNPTFLLSFGAMLIGTETELLLKSRWVLPERLLSHGFVFKYDNLEKTFQNLLRKNK